MIVEKLYICALRVKIKADDLEAQAVDLDLDEIVAKAVEYSTSNESIQEGITGSDAFQDWSELDVPNLESLETTCLLRVIGEASYDLALPADE